MSQIVEHRGTVYLAGQLAEDCSGAIEEQTRSVLKRIDGLLAEVGLTKASILYAQIWLNDIADFQGMNFVWDSWVDAENPPARATGQTGLARKGARLEVMITAARS